MIMDNIDTYNLRGDADFCLSICNDVYWVPFSLLGKSQYKNSNIIIQNSIDKNIKLNNPYEIIQYIQYNNFTKMDNCKRVNKFGIEWDLHLNGMELLKEKKGDCAAYAGLLYYLLNKKYDEVGNLCIMSDTGQGHVINYICLKEHYYFVDLFAQLPENFLYIPIEDGEKATLLRAKYITGACLKAPSLENYIRFLERHNRLKRREYFYFICKGNRIPKTAFTRKNEVLNIMIEKDESIYVIDNKGEKIRYKIIDFNGGELCLKEE